MTIRTYSVEDYGIANLFTDNLVATLEKAAIQPSIIAALDNCQWLIPTEVILTNKLYFLAWLDLYKCLRELGHEYKCDTPESLPLLLLYLKTATKEYVSYDNMDEILLKYGKLTEELFASYSEKPIIKISENSYFSVADILGFAGFAKIRKSYVLLLFRNADRIAKADNHITAEEEVWLEKIKSINAGVYDINVSRTKTFVPAQRESEYAKTHNLPGTRILQLLEQEANLVEEELNPVICTDVVDNSDTAISLETETGNEDTLDNNNESEESVHEEESNEEILEFNNENSTIEKPVSEYTFDKEQKEIKTLTAAEKLESLIGRDTVKKQIKQIVNLLRVQVLKEKRSMTSSRRPVNYFFVGNPGTGKYTFASIYAEMLKDCGAMETNKIMCIGREQLEGSTAKEISEKVKAAFNEAIGGVLFVDDLQDFILGEEDVVGKTISYTLINSISAYWNRIAIVLSGSAAGIKYFKSKVGFVNDWVDSSIVFDDYNSDELTSIFKKVIADSECYATSDAIAHIKGFFDTAISMNMEVFDNADLVLDIADAILVEQANRLSEFENPSDEMLSTIEEDDVLAAFSLMSSTSSNEEEPDGNDSTDQQVSEIPKQKPVGKNVYLKKKNAKAMAVYDKKNGITVLAGSILQDECTASFNVEKRNALMEGNVELQDGKLVLVNDLHFRTPSGASDFVLGASSNGWTEWKTRKGNSLDDLYRKK